MSTCQVGAVRNVDNLGAANYDGREINSCTTLEWSGDIVRCSRLAEQVPGSIASSDRL